MKTFVTSTKDEIRQLRAVELQDWMEAFRPSMFTRMHWSKQRNKVWMDHYYWPLEAICGALLLLDREGQTSNQITQFRPIAHSKVLEKIA
jgi:hypothetical protein